MWVHFERCLKAHDWYYTYSDDGGVWRAGQEQREYLTSIYDRAKKIDEDRANRLYGVACPWLNEDGSRKEDQ